MQTFNLLKTFTTGDFINIRRDSLLSWMIGMPLFTALLIRLALPRLAGWLATTYAFDLTPYDGLLLSVLLVFITPILLGAVIGFLLLDERDDQTLLALQVTPLPLNRYLLYRLGLPVVLSMGMNLLIVPLTGIDALPFPTQVPVVLLAALEAPLLALFLATFAENKVAGFALMKGINAVLFLSIVAYFVPPPWQGLAALIPTYWPLKLWWVLSAGGSGWGYFGGGLIFHLLLLAALLKRFETVLHR